jgi:hypothetical protein
MRCPGLTCGSVQLGPRRAANDVQRRRRGVWVPACGAEPICGDGGVRFKLRGAGFPR